MRYAIVSDIHANESALRRVLEDASNVGAESLICLGDVVGYGPQPKEALAIIRRTSAATICGNHDAAVSGRCDTTDFNGLAADAVERHSKSLNAADRDWLRELPYTCEFAGAIATHGDFTDPPRFNYISNEDDAARNFLATSSSLMFVGHTHEPGIFLTGQSGNVYRKPPQDFSMEEGKRYIVNVGSVGYPRENDGTCFSSYVLYDSSAKTIHFRLIPFDVSSLLQRGALPRKRLGVLFGGLFATSVLAVAGIMIGSHLNNESAPTMAPQEIAIDDNLVLSRKSLTLRKEWKAVRANLKVDRKCDPVNLKLEFKTAYGEDVKMEVVKVAMSSSKTFKIPKDAISAHFTVLRQKPDSNARIIEFEPSFK